MYNGLIKEDSVEKSLQFQCHMPEQGRECDKNSELVLVHTD